MSAKLYEITEQFKELGALADGADEDLSIAIHDTLQAINAEFEDKARAVAIVGLNMDLDIEAIDSAIKRLQERKRLYVNRQNELKGYLRRNMEATGITKISCPLFAITLVKGREVAIIDDEGALPDDMVRVKTDIAPDKLAIAKALKEGKEVPGARLERAQSSVRIK